MHKDFKDISYIQLIDIDSRKNGQAVKKHVLRKIVNVVPPGLHF